MAEGLEAAKPFIKVLCEAQQRVAAQAAKETADYPVFADYGRGRLRRRRPPRSSDELAKALTIAGKQDREAETDRVKALATEQLAEQFEGREKEISGAYRALTKKLVRERIISDGRAHRRPRPGRHPPAVRRGRTCCPGCTGRRCSSAARRRSSASPR